MHRTILSLLLLVFLASNALAGLHVATHATPDPGECVFCAAYNDPADVVPERDVTVPPAPLRQQVSEHHRAAPESSSVFSIRQRGPPASI